MLVKKERRRVSGGDGGTDMNERLAAALEQLPFWPNLTEPQRELARRGARLAQYDRGAPVRATHEQIARDTGAVRETVTRMLRHFADDGIVSLGRGTVTVADAEKLRRLAGM